MDQITTTQPSKPPPSKPAKKRGKRRGKRLPRLNGAGVPRIRYRIGKGIGRPPTRHPRPDGEPTKYQLAALAHWEVRRANGTDRGYKSPQRSRAGVPDGMRRAEAHALRAAARKKAEAFVDELFDGQVVPPDSDDGKAKAALTELATIGLSPGNAQHKIAALRTVLEYTKAKPAQKSDVKISTAEQWLADVIADSQKTTN